jgi:chemotaxis protein methyltransferase CheR
VDSASFHALRGIVHRHSGIHLAATKMALVTARVGRRLRALGLSDVRRYLEYLEADETGAELSELLDAITTHFTSFFREPDHFTLLEAEARRLAAAGQRRLRVWSAACATGEEPWSMAMCLHRALEGVDIDWRLLATDLSRSALAVAEAGRYERERTAPIPPALAARYVRGDGEVRVVDEALRRYVVFGQLNLVEPLPLKGPLDVVFCRNVLIYFDAATRQDVVARIARLLAPGGLLVVSHAESLGSRPPGLEYVRPSVYRAVGADR